MVYKNLSRTTKTFYGVTFKPKESHDVPGYINDSNFIRVDEPKEPPKADFKKSTAPVKKPVISESEDSSTSNTKQDETKTNIIKGGTPNGSDSDK